MSGAAAAEQHSPDPRSAEQYRPDTRSAAQHPPDSGAPSSPSAPSAPPGSAVALIAMVAANGVIGDGEDQPWHLREDLRRFLRLTQGHPVVMGRRTWDAIGAALPGRPTVVLTRDPTWAAEGAQAAADPQQALDLAAALPGGDVIWVLGGGQVYEALLPAATLVELTEVDAPAVGQTRFPTLPPTEWTQAVRDDRLAFAFVTYRRSARPVRRQPSPVPQQPSGEPG